MKVSRILKKLKQKYDLDFYIERNDYNRLMSIIDNIDKGQRSMPEDIIWLTLSRDDLYRGYFTDTLNKKYHKKLFNDVEENIVDKYIESKLIRIYESYIRTIINDNIDESKVMSINIIKKMKSV